VPAIWRDGHVSLGELWKLYSQYPYMSRLRDRQVLDDGLREMPMLWATDAFALATSYDAENDRYVGLWVPHESPTSAPAAVDSLLLVRSDRVERQRLREDRTTSPVEKVLATRDGELGGATLARAHPAARDRPARTRFYGSKSLQADRIVLELQSLTEEVIAHLRQPGTQLSVRIDIEATRTSGFDDNVIRTVSENATTLRFDDSAFEEA
jgi:hypothetical protein